MKLPFKLLAPTVICMLINLPAVAADKKDGVIAIVNGSNITASMLEQYQKTRGFIKNVDKQQQTQLMIEELINREVLYQEGIKNGLDKTPEVQKQFDLLKKNIVAGAALSKAADIAQISDKDLKAEYDKQKKRLATKEYKASHILLENENDAKAVITLLDKGKDFAQLAKDKSTGPSATHGGDLGWFKPQEMVPPFATAVATLKNNEYTKHPVKTDFGWHVILRVDSREVAAPPFEQLKEQLKMRVQNLQVENYIKSLRQKAKIERTSKSK